MAGNELSTETSHHDHHYQDGPVVSRDINARFSLTVAFAFVAGTGVVLMMLAGAIGVIQGASANNDLLGLMFMAGTAFLIVGGVAWTGIIRPWEDYPSVTEGFFEVTPAPQHAHHDDDADHHAEAHHSAH
jgi:ABC-type nickel/cobalt efflux system permease component RcnA